MPAGDAVRDDRIRFTSRKVPENPSVKERAGLPFGVLVQPHLPRSRDGTDASSRDAIERAVPEVVSAEDVARCTECFGYINGYCGFERDGWICILCGTFSYWPGDGGASSRYRRNPNRRLLPEIAGADIDMEVAVEHVVFDPESPVGTAPAYVTLIDLTLPEHALESVKSAVLAAMEATGDAALFGVACFDTTMTVIDASNESTKAIYKRVAVNENGALSVPLQDIMPLASFLVPVRTHKDRIAAAVEALAPAIDQNAVLNDDNDGGAAASTLIGDDAPSSLRLGTPLRSFSPDDDDGTSARDKTPSFLSTLASAARRSAKKPPGRGGLLDAPSGAAGEKRGALASLVSALRGASVRDGSEEDANAFGMETAHRGQGRASKKLKSWGGSRGARAFGPALEATLTFLGAEGVEDADTAARGGGLRLPAAEAPRHPTCRVMAFLAGAPDLGDGAVAGPAGREGRGPADAADASPRDAYASSASAADDAIEPTTSFYADAGDRAALAAVAVDIFCVDTNTRGDAAGTTKTSGYLASVAPLASRSGGALFRYGAAGWDDDAASAPPVPRDAFRALVSERCVRERDVSMDDARAGETSGDALHCTLRVRTSAEFVVSAARGGGIVPDETYEGLFHVPRCSSLDGFAFDLEHARPRGFGRGGDCPPTAQMAFEFTRIETLFENDPEEKTRESETNDKILSARVIGITRRRVRRVCTRQAAVASNPEDVLASADAEATFGVVYRKILDAAEEDGVAEARELLADWLAALSLKHARESRDSRHVDLEGRSLSERVDASFANAPALRKVAKWTHAALARSAALAVPGFAAECLESHDNFFSADARAFAFWTHRRLGPSALAKTVYPEITAWTHDGGFLESTRMIDAANAGDEDDADTKNANCSNDEMIVVPATIIPASREALIQSGGSLFVADAHDTVVAFQAPAQPGTPAALAAFPPQRASPARAFVENARRHRSPAPSVSYVRGGLESPVSFDRLLVEQMDVFLMPGGQTIFGGLEGFRRATEARARAMLGTGDS